MTSGSKLSPRSAQFRALMEDSQRFVETCEGGDPGTPKAPSIWLMGLEPGWSNRDDAAEKAQAGIDQKELASYSIDLQLTWTFNRKAFQLLAALKEENPRQYVAFARRERPFENGSKGYLKLNLFAAACNNIGKWDSEHVDETGFDSKEDYQAWMRKARLPVLRGWIEKCRPKLIICTGVTYLEDFIKVAGVIDLPPAHYITVNGHSKRMHMATDGLVPIAVIPHLSSGVHSLNSYESIAKCASFIRDSLSSNSSAMG